MKRFLTKATSRTRFDFSLHKFLHFYLYFEFFPIHLFFLARRHYDKVPPLQSPEKLLLVSKRSTADPMPADTPEARLAGWKKMCLLVGGGGADQIKRGNAKLRRLISPGRCQSLSTPPCFFTFEKRKQCSFNPDILQHLFAAFCKMLLCSHPRRVTTHAFLHNIMAHLQTPLVM